MGVKSAISCFPSSMAKRPPLNGGWMEHALHSHMLQAKWCCWQLDGVQSPLLCALGTCLIPTKRSMETWMHASDGPWCLLLCPLSSTYYTCGYCSRVRALMAWHPLIGCWWCSCYGDVVVCGKIFPCTVFFLWDSLLGMYWLVLGWCDLLLAFQDLEWCPHQVLSLLRLGADFWGTHSLANGLVPWTLGTWP